MLAFKQLLALTFAIYTLAHPTPSPSMEPTPPTTVLPTFVGSSNSPTTHQPTTAPFTLPPSYATSITESQFWQPPQFFLEVMEISLFCFLIWAAGTAAKMLKGSSVIGNFVTKF